MILRAYQERAKEELKSNLLTKDYLLLNSPTGSGKTVIMTELMKDIVQEFKDIVFVWVSARPSLIKQSSKYATAPHLNAIHLDKLNLYTEGLSNGDVLYVNWEKVRSKDNSCRIDSPTNTSIDTILERTRQNGLDIILINDESHFGSDTKLANTLIEEVIQPYKRIDVSATPTNKNYDFRCNISLEDVREYEMIKKGFRINTDLIEYNSETRSKFGFETIEEYIIFNAVMKHKELIKQHEKAEQGIKPLMLIQLPNKDDKLSEVVSYLSKIGYSESNGKVGIYTNNYYSSDLETITNDEDIEVIIFKQALSFGWDNPRSHTLVFLRSSVKDDFMIQTLGRVLRNPYRKYFSTELEDLNYAYIYMPYKDVNVISTLENKIIDEGYGILTRKDLDTNIDKLFKLKIVDNGTNVKRMFALKRILRNLKELEEFKQLSIDFKQIEKVLVKDSYSEEFDLTDNELKKEYVNINDLSENDVYGMILNKLNSDKFPELSQTILDTLLDSIEEDTLTKQMYNILSNYHTYLTIVNKQIQQYDMESKRYQIKPTQWKTPKSLIATEDNYCRKGIENCLYNNFDVSGSMAEKTFINYLETAPNVKTWYKNGDSGEEHYSIPYKHENTLKNHFPDFIIELNDGTIHLVETKTKFMDIPTYSKYKDSKGVTNLLSKQLRMNVKYDLVVVNNDELFKVIDNCENFEDITNSGNWVEFSL